MQAAGRSYRCGRRRHRVYAESVLELRNRVRSLPIGKAVEHEQMDGPITHAAAYSDWTVRCGRGFPDEGRVYLCACSHASLSARAAKAVAASRMNWDCIDPGG